MADGGDGSITRWFESLKSGDRAAVGVLWEHYFESMIRLARATLRQRSSGRAVADEEGAALSAFVSFVAGAEDGRFPHLNDREELWRLLAIITVRKARAQLRQQRRLKRGGGLVLRETDLVDGGAGLDGLDDREPGPELTALAAEGLLRLLELLDDEVLRQVACWRMEGLTCTEIAGRLGCARRTVARQLALIRKLWASELGSDRD